MDSQSIWRAVLGEIEVTLPQSSYSAWFSGSSLEIDQDNTVTILAKNIFSKTQMEKRFNDLILQCLAHNGLELTTVTYGIKPDPNKRKKTINRELPQLSPINNSTSLNDSTTPATTSVTGVGRQANPSNLNPRYNFDSFIVGSSNDLAYAACQAVANHPGNKYNPLFLYGGSGLGKTHLMQAVGNHITQTRPKARVLYTTIDTFVQEFLDSIRFKSKNFSDKYRNVDVLIVDDMQFIAGKEKTQDAFFHTFNELHQNDKQIIISSDKPPKNIPTLTDRLRSRFEWGMTIDVQMPDYETRCAIVKAKADLSGATLDDQIVEYLATNFKTNIRELEGALNQLLAYAEMQNIVPDLGVAEGLLANVKQSRPQHVTAKQIIDKTARHFGIDPRDMRSARRDKLIMLPRQIAMYLLRSELKMSFPKIAQELGRKDHTTAMHSVEKITREGLTNVVVREQINDVRNKLYG